MEKVRHAQYKSLRRCGGCRECCRYFALGGKAAGVWCKHVTPEGCAVHDAPDRPDVCKTYLCLWRMSNLPATFRPDRCKLIVTERDDYKGHAVVSIGELADGATRTRDGKLLVRCLKAHGYLVLLSGRDCLPVGGWYKHVKGMTANDMQLLYERRIAEARADVAQTDTFWD
jgi:hypothetical protein